VLTAPSDINDNPAWVNHVMNDDVPPVAITCTIDDVNGDEPDLAGDKPTLEATESVVGTRDITLLCRLVAAGLPVTGLPPSGASLSLEPQITRRMGKSFGQLLTKRAVLIALGLAGFGGGGGCNCAVVVDIRLRGSLECGVGVESDALGGLDCPDG